ncbi:MAG: hypothetical protein U0599_01340 [Vicinamibacteria bacterium]
MSGSFLTIAGLPNIYGALEFSGLGVQSQWAHALAHLTIGLLAATLLWWGASCSSLLVGRRLARGASARSTAPRWR